MLNVWAREGSPQSPQLCAPTAQVQALPVTPLSSSCKLQKNDAFAVRQQCFVVSHTPKHSIRCRTVQGTTSPLHLCSAQITYKCSLCPSPVPSTHFSLAGAFWAITPADHLSEFLSQNKAGCMLMRGNILLMQKVNWRDKFKSFLCHYYRQVLEFDQVYREL